MYHISIDPIYIFVELRFVIELLPKEKLGTIHILNFLKPFSYFSNTIIVYIILFIILIVAAFVKKCF